MTDISHMTWKYLHGADDAAHLSFPTGGVPRSFSVVQYAATEVDEIDFNRNGLAVIDNDHMSVVLDEHCKGSAVDQTSAMAEIRKMDWETFSTFCADHPRYRGKSQDMTLPVPDAGVLVNQIQRGVMHAPTDEADLRSPSMVKANADEDCPYSFPAATRHQMIQDILDHSCIKDEAGNWRIAWDCHFDATVPATGISQDATELDMAWAQHYEGNPEIFYQISGKIIEPYFTGSIGTWPDTDKGRYGFTSSGALNSDTLCLSSIDGVDLGFRNKGDLGLFLDGLEDVAVRDVWKLIKVVDHDLSQKVIEKEFSRQIELARDAFEAEREAESDLIFG
jgi:hypothetical protein